MLHKIKFNVSKVSDLRWYHIWRRVTWFKLRKSTRQCVCN